MTDDAVSSGRPWAAFHALWAASASSNLADGVLRTAAPLFAVAVTRDPVLVAGLTVAQYLPWLVLTLWSGVITDRYDRRTLLILGNALRAGAVLAFSAAVLLQGGTIFLLYGAVFLIGAGETVVDNASLTVLPRVVDRSLLNRANGRIVATQSVIDELVGPPLGAALFTLAAVAAFATGSALFGVAAIAAAFLPSMAPQAAADAAAAPVGFRTQLVDGLRFFWTVRVLREAAFVSANINLWGTATGAVLVLLLTDQYGLDPLGYGIVLAAAAVGGIAGGLLADRVIRLVGPGTVMLLVCAIEAVDFLVLGAASLPAVAVAALGAGAFINTSNQVVVSSLRQAAVPDHILGRVTSAYRLIVLGAVPVGAAVGGFIAAGFGTAAVFSVAAAGMAAGAVVAAIRLPNRVVRLAMQSGGE